ncbi:MAG: hypothetical protein J0H98_05385 [Solirubrobacterales bacterium]|nr:hypothetical protein [Solirubrobacterales bacterium]
MANPAKFSIGDTLQALRVALEKDRSLIVRLTVLFAALNAASNLLDFTGPAGFAVSTGILVLLGSIYGGLITALICLPGRTESVGELWEVVRPVLARLVWVTLITAVGVVLGCLALILPGLFLFTIWSVGAQTVVVERTGVFDALTRSFELVRDHAWRVFLYLLALALLSLLMVALALLVSLPLGTGMIGTSIATFLANALTAPIFVGGSAVLYSGLAALEQPDEPEEQDPFATH